MGTPKTKKPTKSTTAKVVENESQKPYTGKRFDSSALHEPVIQNNHDFLCIYTVKNGNPNGDPTNGNAPRVDGQTGHHIASEMSIKRWIRNHLWNLGYEILVRQTSHNGGVTISDAKARARDFIGISGEESEEERIAIMQVAAEDPADREKIEKAKAILLSINSKRNILATCIDGRMFGTMIPTEWDKEHLNIGASGKSVKDFTISIHGPIQIQPAIEHTRTIDRDFSGRGGFASSSENVKETVRHDHKLSYAIMGFNGTINSNSAKDTMLSEKDVAAFFNALWFWAIELRTSSKGEEFMHTLVDVEYKPGYNQTPYFSETFNIVPVGTATMNTIRKVKEFAVDVTDTVEALKARQDKISAIHVNSVIFAQYMYNGVLSKSLVQIFNDNGLPADDLKYD